MTVKTFEEVAQLKKDVLIEYPLHDPQSEHHRLFFSRKMVMYVWWLNRFKIKTYKPGCYDFIRPFEKGEEACTDTITFRVDLIALHPIWYQEIFRMKIEEAEFLPGSDIWPYGIEMFDKPVKETLNHKVSRIWKIEYGSLVHNVLQIGD